VVHEGVGEIDRSWAEPLPPSVGSLARGVWPTTPGTMIARSVDGGITVGPRAGRSVLFGRNADEVHVCIGADDRRVSRRHGALRCDGERWWLHNLGRSPIRLPDRRLFPSEEPLPLVDGYTPVFLPGTREHLLEVYVVGRGGDRRAADHSRATIAPSTWPLSADEKLALIVLGQRYLLHEPNPQPLTWRQTADQLGELQPPTSQWSAKRVEHLVGRVRARLSRAGVAGLTREEVAGPVGNALNHNLISELVRSTTLVPPDLRRLEPPA
jgi:FHA domain-containing protein